MMSRAAVCPCPGHPTPPPRATRPAPCHSHHHHTHHPPPTALCAPRGPSPADSTACTAASASTAARRWSRDRGAAMGGAAGEHAPPSSRSGKSVWRSHHQGRGQHTAVASGLERSGLHVANQPLVLECLYMQEQQAKHAGLGWARAGQLRAGGSPASPCRAPVTRAAPSHTASLRNFRVMVASGAQPPYKAGQHRPSRHHSYSHRRAAASFAQPLQPTPHRSNTTAHQPLRSPPPLPTDPRPRPPPPQSRSTHTRVRK